jgi:4-amino-4-deoxy-L-arabinose transferase-like glycosyltransferase
MPLQETIRRPNDAGRHLPPRSVDQVVWIARSRIAYALILLFGLALYLPGLRTLPAVDRDEARFAQSSRQMLESGDYVDIRFQDEARLKKPVGIYWLQAAATALAGGEHPANPIWTYRLPSLLGAIGALIVVLAIGRSWFGAEPGFLAAALLGACLLLGFEARQAKTDAVLLFTVVVAMGGLAAAWIAPATDRLPRRRWLSFWIAIAVGILVKGPIILMVAGLAAVVLSLHDRSLRWLLRLRPWPGVAVALVIVLPWLIAITIASHGAFFSQSLGGDLAAKLAGVQESHGAPPGYFLAMFPVAFWPGSLFALPAALWAWRNRRDRAVVFCLAWILPAWLVFELVPTKLPHYVLPLYPAIALLVAAFLTDRLDEARKRWPSRLMTVLWCLVGIALGAAVVAAAPLADGRLSLGGILAGLAIWVLTAGAGRSAWRGGWTGSVAVCLIGAIFVWGLVFGAALPALRAPWIAPALKEALFDALPTGHGPVLIAGFGEPSAVLDLGTATRFGEGKDAAEFLRSEPGAIVIVGDDQRPAFDTAVRERMLDIQALTTVEGFNYAKGRRARLTIFRRAP